jgi:predicted nucleotidyltransferase
MWQVTDAEIQAIADEIGRQFRPERVILFGSRARGEATPDSDVDLLVVMPPEGRLLDQTLQILKAIRPWRRFPLDLIVQDPQELALRYAGHDPIARDALERGKVLYEHRSDA